MARSNSKDAPFGETQWTLVLTAAERDSPSAEKALAQLCEDYYRPLYAFLRRRGNKPEEAEDLLQAFIELLLKKNFLDQADRTRGRFRTFLLSALCHFLSNQQKAGRVIKRGGKCSFVSRDAAGAEQIYQSEPVDELTPERIFERQWAVSVLQKAMLKLQDEYSRAEKAAHFQALKVFLSGQSEAPLQSPLAEQLGISKANLRVAVWRMRQRYGDLIRREVADTVLTQTEVKEEVRHLLAVLSGS